MILENQVKQEIILKLGIKHAVLYEFIANCDTNNKNDLFFVCSIKKVSSALRISAKTQLAIIKRLEKSGYLIKKRKNGSRERYFKILK